MKKSARNSGFTLAELVVALSISVIALAMASVLLVGLFKTFDNGTTYNQQSNELKSVKYDVGTFAKSSQDSGYVVDLNSDWTNALTFKKAEENDKVLLFNEGKIFIDNKQTDAFAQIKNVCFALNNDMIVCKVVFLDESEITFIV